MMKPPRTHEAYIISLALDGIKDDHVRNVCADFALRCIQNTASIETTGKYAQPEDLMAYIAGMAATAQAKKKSGKVIQFAPYLERRRNEES